MAGDDVVARRAIAPRYEPEFMHIGTSRANLEELASRTGGRVVEADEHGPLPIRLPSSGGIYPGSADWPRWRLIGAAVILLRRRM